MSTVPTQHNDPPDSPGATTIKTEPPGPADPPGPAAGTAYRWRWPALLVVLLADVMDLLDALITTIAGPTIVRDLGGGETTIQWLSAGYTLAMAAGLLIGGRLGDIFGRKLMFVIGIAGFTLFSLVCALAPSPGVLVFARVLQGLCGAMLLPQGLGLIKEMFPPAEMGKAFGAFGPLMGIGAVGGPVLAGWLVDADVFGWGWRAIFAINIPIGVLAVLLALRFLPANRPQPGVTLDVPGAVLASGGMFLLVYPLVQGRENGWPAWAFLMLAGAAVTFALFAAVQLRRGRRGRSTLVLPSLFRKRAFLAGLATGLAFFSALMGLDLIVSLYTQIGLGFSPLKAGLTALPQALGMMLGFAVAQGLNTRLGRTLMMIGMPIVALGLLLFAAVIGWAGDSISIWSMAAPLGLVGIGMGLSMAPFFDIVLAGVDEHESGSASGSMTSVQQVGGSLGVAVLGTVFFSVAGHPRGDRIATFGHATQLTLLAAVAFVVVALALTVLLPAKARPDTPPH
ncbi:MFS transporter [Nakamurella aerolata]|uniref:MFS transporter n=1 Tax=Nakamurella aerolata TaxID=1656892 RepID=A0A849A6L4_9ACTN|nr:MFS transporter [Nakamurella aerolata]NNG36155.1 MFS transporter [Nakamurella aerolata]